MTARPQWAAREMLEHLGRCVVPRAALTVTQWADRHRIVTTKQGGIAGPYRSSLTPYMAEIMDCLSAHSRVEEVVVMKPAQIGLTEAIVNWIGYVIAHAPAPMMVIMPSLEARDKWKAQKLNPLFTDTPAVREILGGVRGRDAANRQDLIDFPGGALFLAGGNSPNSYAQSSVRYIVMDDLDRFPPEVGEEGDPVSLARVRTTAFPGRAKRVFVSTPTVAGESLIEREFEASDQRRWHVACVHCGELQRLDPAQIKVAGGDAEAPGAYAYFVCPACGATLREEHRGRLIAGGRWMAQYPERSRRGYHMSEFDASPALSPSWLELCREQAAAARHTTKLRVFTNTRLGLPFKEDAEEIEPDFLLARLEEYPEELPGIECRSAGVDVQANRIEVTIVDWAADNTAWVRDHIVVAGDSTHADTWRALDRELVEWKVDVAGVDRGFLADYVDAFVTARGWCYALIGQSGEHRRFIDTPRDRGRRLRGKRKSAHVEPIGVDVAKEYLFARLKYRDPRAAQYIHFPNEPAFDREYFAQLAGEKKVSGMANGVRISRWVKTRQRNEALDCLVYAWAARNLPHSRRGQAPAAPQRRIINRGRFA